jgi:hypothetical protein
MFCKQTGSKEAETEAYPQKVPPKLCSEKKVTSIKPWSLAERCAAPINAALQKTYSADVIVLQMSLG